MPRPRVITVFLGLLNCFLHFSFDFFPALATNVLILLIIINKYFFITLCNLLTNIDPLITVNSSCTNSHFDWISFLTYNMFINPLTHYSFVLCSVTPPSLTWLHLPVIYLHLCSTLYCVSFCFPLNYSCSTQEPFS